MATSATNDDTAAGSSTFGVAGRGVSIRRATTADADPVFSLVEQLSDTYNVDRDAFDEAFSAAVQQEHDHVLFIAEAPGNRVVGYVLMTIAKPLYMREDAAQIQELIVDREARSSGVGSQLVYAVEGVCRSLGIQQLTVASSRAPAFYDRLDYRSTADYLKKRFDAEL